MKKRRKLQPDFKAQIALEALKGLKPIAQIAKEHTVHPVQIGDWKKVLQTRAPELFGKVTGSNTEELMQELERARSTIGRLTLDLDYLKKKSAVLGLVIEPDALTTRSLG